MDIETLRTVGADLFGNGWQTRLAKALGIDGSTVRRWLANGVEAPPAVGAYLRMLGDRQETRGAVLYLESRRSDIPIRVRMPTLLTLDFMKKRLAFEGVEQLKPMPAIHSAYDAEGGRVVRIDGSPSDAIVDIQSDYEMVRHPDGRHLKGYLDAAEADGVAVAVATHRFHHYTLVMHRPVGLVGMIDYRIATHSGEIRRLVVMADDHSKVIASSLTTVLKS